MSLASQERAKRIRILHPGNQWHEICRRYDRNLVHFYETHPIFISSGVSFLRMLELGLEKAFMQRKKLHTKFRDLDLYVTVKLRSEVGPNKRAKFVINPGDPLWWDRLHSEIARYATGATEHRVELFSGVNGPVLNKSNRFVVLNARPLELHVVVDRSMPANYTAVPHLESDASDIRSSSTRKQLKRQGALAAGDKRDARSPAGAPLPDDDGGGSDAIDYADIGDSIVSERVKRGRLARKARADKGKPAHPHAGTAPVNTTIKISAMSIGDSIIAKKSSSSGSFSGGGGDSIRPETVLIQSMISNLGALNLRRVDTVTEDAAKNASIGTSMSDYSDSALRKKDGKRHLVRNHTKIKESIFETLQNPTSYKDVREPNEYWRSKGVVDLPAFYEEIAERIADQVQSLPPSFMPRVNASIGDSLHGGGGGDGGAASEFEPEGSRIRKNAERAYRQALIGCNICDDLENIARQNGEYRANETGPTSQVPLLAGGSTPSLGGSSVVERFWTKYRHAFFKPRVAHDCTPYEYSHAYLPHTHYRAACAPTVVTPAIAVAAVPTVAGAAHCNCRGCEGTSVRHSQLYCKKRYARCDSDSSDDDAIHPYCAASKSSSSSSSSSQSSDDGKKKKKNKNKKVGIVTDPVMIIPKPAAANCPPQSYFAPHELSSGEYDWHSVSNFMTLVEQAYGCSPTGKALDGGQTSAMYMLVVRNEVFSGKALDRVRQCIQQGNSIKAFLAEYEVPCAPENHFHRCLMSSGCVSLISKTKRRYDVGGSPLCLRRWDSRKLDVTHPSIDQRLRVDGVWAHPRYPAIYFIPIRVAHLAVPLVGTIGEYIRTL